MLLRGPFTVAGILIGAAISHNTTASMLAFSRDAPMHHLLYLITILTHSLVQEVDQHPMVAPPGLALAFDPALEVANSTVEERKFLTRPEAYQNQASHLCSSV